MEIRLLIVGQAVIGEDVDLAEAIGADGGEISVDESSYEVTDLEVQKESLCVTASGQVIEVDPPLQLDHSFELVFQAEKVSGKFVSKDEVAEEILNSLSDEYSIEGITFAVQDVQVL